MRRFSGLSFLFGFLFLCQTIQVHAQTQLGKQADLPPGRPSLIRFNAQKQLTASKQPQKVLEENLGMGTNDKLLKTSASTDPLGYSHEKYQQFYKGIKVEYGVYSVHAKNAVIESISGEYYKIPELSITSTLSEKQALQRALSFTGATQYKWELASEEKGIKNIQNDPQATYFPKAELLICPKFLNQAKGATADMALAYKFDIYAHEPLSRNLIYVDAHTGEVIFKDPIIKHVDGQAATRYSGTRTIQTQLISGSYQLKDNSRLAAIETYNMKTGTDYSLATNFTDVDNNWTSAEYNNLAKDNAALDAHWGAAKTYDYFLTKHGRKSFDNNNGAIRSYVHYMVNYDNAFWDGSRMTYGDGGTQFDALTSIDVVGHEIGHAVCEKTANLIYSYESGALNEGLSDIWGANVERFAAPEKNNWLIGEQITKQGVAAMRSLSDPKSQGQPNTYLGINWYTGTADNGGVHKNSGVLNFWYYLLSVGKTGTNDNGDNYTVTGIGMDKAASIVYRAESVYLTATSQYTNAREFSIQAATDLYGVNSNEVTQTINAWNAVGVYEAIPAPSYLTATATTSVTLTWKDNTTNETGFRIERSSTPGGVFALVLNVGPNIVSSANIAQLANTVYYYRVKAIKGIVVSPASNEAQVILGTATSTRTVPESDYQALVDLYYSTNGVNWTNKTNWLVGNVDNWYGVTVTGGRVTNLVLDHNQLTGSIPTSVGNLTALTSIYLRSNQLTGSIPRSVGNLTALQRLYLDGNQLNGPLPIELGNLLAVQEIELGNNQFSGSIPVSLGNLLAVVFIELRSNKLTGNIPASLGNLKTLQKLLLGVNQLTGAIPASLGNVKTLQYIQLENNQLTGAIPTSLGTLPALKSIYVSYNQLTGTIPNEIGNLTTLQGLV